MTRLIDYGPFISNRSELKPLSLEEVEIWMPGIIEEISELRNQLNRAFPAGIDEQRAEIVEWLTAHLGALSYRAQCHLAHNHSWI